MQLQSKHFKELVAEKLADKRLQTTLARTKGKFTEKRAIAIQELDNFEEIRNAAKDIRNRVLNNLDLWLEQFEKVATHRGSQVLWAIDGSEVNRLVVEIARRHGVKKVIKSKSMLSEEANLNVGLEAAGIQVVETDLGEYILQINNNEPPSHIIAPVVHKDKEQIAELFAKVHLTPLLKDIPSLALEARHVLRSHFLSADMGISGGNFLVAETGSLALVTNEGNGRMVTTLPRVHVAITGIEKVVPTLEDLATLMRLLPRSATGQSISNYFSVLTGPRQDQEGPEHMYFILVDNGRANLLGTDFQEMLRCIRCGACMNHCPVYETIGGHAYGWVYPGPMGSVLTPLYVGIENALHLPNAATLCGQCQVVCPVKIPLPDLMRKLRERQIDLGLRSWSERLMLMLWADIALRPRFYSVLSRIASRVIKWTSRYPRALARVPFARGWFSYRYLPQVFGKTFRELYESGEKVNEVKKKKP